MIILGLMAVPLAAGLACFFVRADAFRRGLLVAGAGGHFVLTCLAFLIRPVAAAGGWFVLDDLGLLFLGITSLLFLGAAVYGVRYLALEKLRLQAAAAGEGRFSDAPEAVFTGCLLLFLSTMTAVVVSQHLGILWVAIEATTLSSAPLIYFHRNKRSLEATWKYLLLCSVGIALALLGVFFLAVANAGHDGVLVLKDLTGAAAGLNVTWLKAAFLFIFVGYGTKMGLAPLHTWLPDAHSEAPSMISALLSGALLNCAFLGILRVYQVCVAAGIAPYCQEIFRLFGLLSIAFAAFFILWQVDYKRMLAYSSVEHMGILALGIGIGGSAVFGSLVNAFGHALTKAGLFFIAGNILSYQGTKFIPDIQGLLNGKLRRSGVLWLTGFLLITGTPPSGIFIGKFLILKAALARGYYGITLIFLAALVLIFVGMARIFISMTQGLSQERAPVDRAVPDNLLNLLPSGVFFVIVALLGVYLPGWFARILNDAALGLGGL